MLEYVVYGVQYDGLKVVNGRAVKLDECVKFQKSKYVLSDTNGCFTKVLDDLINGKKVLFSGTPCQVSALKKFLLLKKCNFKNLMTIDILCHGAPSQEIFDAYLNELQSINGQIKQFSFRNKLPINGKVDSRSVEIMYNSGDNQLLNLDQSSYLKAYHSRLFYRSSCYKCKFADIKRFSDLTIADAWGIEKIYPNLDSTKGVSLILVNSNNGENILEIIKGKMVLHKVALEWAIANNDTLRGPSKQHKKRKKFLGLYNKGFTLAVNKALKRNFIRKLMSVIKSKMISKKITGRKEQ